MGKNAFQIFVAGETLWVRLKLRRDFTRQVVFEPVDRQPYHALPYADRTWYRLQDATQGRVFAGQYKRDVARYA